jgi:hypothetical protein
MACCERIEQEARGLGMLESAAARWREVAEAAENLDGDVASTAYTRAVRLLVEARNPNIRLVLGLVESRLGRFAPRHFALTKSVTREGTVGWKDLVTFVEGDATEFDQELARVWEVEDPLRVDVLDERRRLAELIRIGNFHSSSERSDG